MTLDSHCTHLFSKKDDVLFLQDMLWMMGALGRLFETEHLKPGRNMWDEGITLYYTAVPIVFLESCCTES